MPAAIHPANAFPPEVRELLEEPDRHGDLIDFLILFGIAIVVVLSVGAAFLFIDAVWDMVGLGEGSNPPE